MPRSPKSRTRIVATLGPATAHPTTLRKLIRAGADVFRLNFSHGTHAFHAQCVKDVRAVADELGIPVAVLQDLCGPKMRVGRLIDESVRLRTGAEVRLQEGGANGTVECLPVESGGALARVKPGDVVRLADGLIELRVLAREGKGVRCGVVHGGVLRSRQGVNIPCVDLGVKALTAKDEKDLAFGVTLGVDAVALSFVRAADDVLALRKRVRALGAPPPFVVAKIERAEALEHLDDILEVSSGVMVARGDLGVEIGFEKVPAAQLRIIEAARRAFKPVITATQMLESMIDRPTPTRAEVADIATAVMNGTDALMLSGETAVGKHPVACVKMLDVVATEVEGTRDLIRVEERAEAEVLDVPQAVCRAARVVARSIDAKAVVVFTESGRTARLMSSQRVARHCYGFTPREQTWRRMRFFWGVEPMLMEEVSSVDAMLAEAEALLRSKRLVKRGDRLVIVCGQLVMEGSTNSIHVREVGVFEAGRRRSQGTRKKRAKAKP